MKTKDLIGLVFAVVLIAVVGVVFYKTEFAKKTATKTAATTSYEVAPVVSSSLDSQKLLTGGLTATYKVQDFKQPLDLNSGVGNTAPFGQ